MRGWVPLAAGGRSPCAPSTTVAPPRRASAWATATPTTPPPTIATRATCASYHSAARTRQDAPMRTDLIELTSRLVAIDSVNPALVAGGAGEAEAARFVAAWA